MCVYVYMYVYIYIYIHTHIHTYIHTYTHTHKYTAHITVPVGRWKVFLFVQKKRETRVTAILIIIDARYHDFNSFPVVNWY